MQLGDKNEQFSNFCLEDFWASDQVALPLVVITAHEVGAVQARPQLRVFTCHQTYEGEEDLMSLWTPLLTDAGGGDCSAPRWEPGLSAEGAVVKRKGWYSRDRLTTSCVSESDLGLWTFCDSDWFCVFQYLCCLSTSRSSTDKLAFDVGLQEDTTGESLGPCRCCVQRDRAGVGRRHEAIRCISWASSWAESGRNEQRLSQESVVQAGSARCSHRSSFPCD